MKKITLISLKILITCLFFYFLFKKIDVYQVINIIKNISPIWAFIAILLMLLQILLAGVRWYWVSMILNANIKLKQALGFMLIGQFFGQLLPSSIGGDGMRLYMTHKDGVPLGRASSSILCDRGIGLMISIFLPVLACFLLSPYWGETFINLMHGLNVMALSAVIALIFLHFGQNFIISILKKIDVIKRAANLIRDMHKVVFAHPRIPQLYVISTFIQALSVFIIYSIGRSLSINLPIESLFIIIPSVMLITIIPLSIAGWGIREGAMVIGLSFIGISQTESFAISFIFGLLLISSTLPGLILWVFYKHKN